MADQHDLVIRSATVLDGTGAAGRTADVAVDGDRISAVQGQVSGRGGVEVDATGLALAPGFVDVHTHDDLTVLVDPLHPAKVLQGVTTVVVGNCGWGPAPYRWASLVHAHINAVEGDLPTWEGHAGYLQRVADDPPACNVAALVGHGTLRLTVIGGDDRPATDDELAGMRDVVAEGMAAGAVGLSTGLAYEPGRFAPTQEVVALAAVAAEAGGLYASHIRNEGPGLLDAVAEAIAVGEQAGLAVQVSHHKAAGEAQWGLVRESLSLIEAAQQRGVDVAADQYPYTAASTSLGAVLTEGALGGRWAENPRAGGAFARIGPEQVVIAGMPGRPEIDGRSLAELAEEAGTDPLAVAEELCDAVLGGPFVVLHVMSEDDVRTVLAHPSTMIGSDGIAGGSKPHPRHFGTYPRVLGRYVRELGVLDLPTAVHRMTGMPAARFGLVDRGVVRAGAFADLVLFDPATVADTATYDDPRQPPVGIAGVWVNGRRVADGPASTGARPGRPLRRRC